MSTQRDEAIQKEYENILLKVVGGRLFGEYITNPKELVVAAYHLGRLEVSQEQVARANVLNLDDLEKED